MIFILRHCLVLHTFSTFYFIHLLLNFYNTFTEWFIRLAKIRSKVQHLRSYFKMQLLFNFNLIVVQEADERSVIKVLSGIEAK